MKREGSREKGTRDVKKKDGKKRREEEPRKDFTGTARPPVFH